MKKAKRFFCLSLAALMLASVTACKESNTVSEGSDDVEYVYEYVSGDQSGGNQDGASTGDSSGTGNVSNAGGGSGGTASGSGGGSTGGSGGKGGSTSAKLQAAWEAKAKKYSGKTVVYATWADPKKQEDGPVINAFTKKTGIKVKIDNIAEGGYVNTVASRVAAGNSPDVYFCTNTFPACVNVCQPITAADLDMSDPIWEKRMFELSKINGKSYLVNAVGSIWNGNVTCYYNKQIFKENNLTTPEEYYAAGNWTFDTFEKAMREVTSVQGAGYVGAFIDFNALQATQNCGFWKWDTKNGRYINGINDKFTAITQRMAQWKKDGYIEGTWDNNLTSSFKNGKCGMAITSAWGLKKVGYWRDMNWKDIGFTYVPDYSKSSKANMAGIYRGWGICKGAKQPVAAGVFLRYYLDVNNYDSPSAFISSEAETFFYKLTSSANMTSKHYYFVGLDAPIASTTDSKIASIANGDPNQVKSGMDGLKSQVNKEVKSFNDFLSKLK